jgi:hypothetical protein
MRRTGRSEQQQIACTLYAGCAEKNARSFETATVAELPIDLGALYRFASRRVPDDVRKSALQLAKARERAKAAELISRSPEVVAAQAYLNHSGFVPATHHGFMREFRRRQTEPQPREIRARLLARLSWAFRSLSDGAPFNDLVLEDW